MVRIVHLWLLVWFIWCTPGARFNIKIFYHMVWAAPCWRQEACAHTGKTTPLWWNRAQTLFIIKWRDCLGVRLWINNRILVYHLWINNRILVYHLLYKYIGNSRCIFCANLVRFCEILFELSRYNCQIGSISCPAGSNDLENAGQGHP